MEKGIVLTFETMMKVKNNEIQEMRQENDVLYEEIHQRDNELDTLKKEIESLKAENETLKSENGILKTENDSLKVKNDDIKRQRNKLDWRLKNIREELDDIYTIHQIEMKKKCKEELEVLKSQNQNLTEDEILKKYCDEVFNFKSLKVYPTVRGKYPSDDELKIKIQKMSEHQLALLKLVEEHNISREQIDQLQNYLEKKNIDILKNFLKYFACRSAKAIVPRFLDFFDADGQPKQYSPYYNIDGNIENESGMESDDEYGYPAEFIDIYNFKFEFCGNCECSYQEECWYSRVKLEEF